MKISLQLPTLVKPKSEEFMKSLYDSASWIHLSDFSNNNDEYYFDSFWMDPPLAPRPENKGRKCKNHSLRGSLSTKHEGDNNLRILDIRNQNVNPGIDPKHSLINRQITSTQTGDPRIPQSELVNPSIASTSETHDNSTRDPSITATNDDPSIVSTAMANAANVTASNETTHSLYPHTQPQTLSTTSMTHTRYQQNFFNGSYDFQQTKAQKGIDGNIYIFYAATYNQNAMHTSISSISDTTNKPLIYPSVFSAFHDLPTIHSESTINAFLTLDNKGDTLMQSQMLKTNDSQDFITAQLPEIRGLEKMDVFKYLPMDSLPPRAHLISSIWSYRRKQRPTG
jgi:hypothetical protein